MAATRNPLETIVRLFASDAAMLTYIIQVAIVVSVPGVLLLSVHGVHDGGGI